MGRDLYLVRHGKSDWSVHGQKDYDRPLNDRGHRDSPRMGAIIAKMGISPGMLISSPAVRARMTAEYFAEQLQFEEDRIQYIDDIYEASVRILLNCINQFDDQYEKIMLFGHNPGLTYLVEYLSNEQPENIPTAGVVHIHFPLDSWQAVSGGTGDMMFFEYPKKHKKDQ